MSIYKLIGHFLIDNGHHETFQKLQDEMGQTIETDVNESLEEIVKDRINFNDLKINDSIDDDRKIHDTWKIPYPRTLTRDINVNESVVSVDWNKSKNLLFVSTAKMKFIIIDVMTGDIAAEYHQLAGKVVSKKVLTFGDFVYLVGMNGLVTKFKLNGLELEKLGEINLHKRLVIDMKLVILDGNVRLVSIGWDKMLKVIDENLEVLSEILVSNIVSCFNVLNDSGHLYALVGYNENTVIELFKLQPKNSISLYKISINDAEFMTNMFTPRSIHFRDHLAVISTSHEPFMRLIIIPITDFHQTNQIKRNQILKNVVTSAPQDKFSKSSICLRPQGGVWLLGDDGNIRGINLDNKKEIQIEGHQGRITHLINVTTDKEHLITISDDKHIKLWQ